MAPVNKYIAYSCAINPYDQINACFGDQTNAFLWFVVWVFVDPCLKQVLNLNMITIIWIIIWISFHILVQRMPFWWLKNECCVLLFEIHSHHEEPDVITLMPVLFVTNASVSQIRLFTTWVNQESALLSAVECIMKQQFTGIKAMSLSEFDSPFPWLGP